MQRVLAWQGRHDQFHVVAGRNEAGQAEIELLKRAAHDRRKYARDRILLARKRRVDSREEISLAHFDDHSAHAMAFERRAVARGFARIFNAALDVRLLFELAQVRQLFVAQPPELLMPHGVHGAVFAAGDLARRPAAALAAVVRAVAARVAARGLARLLAAAAVLLVMRPSSGHLFEVFSRTELLLRSIFARFERSRSSVLHSKQILPRRFRRGQADLFVTLCREHSSAGRFEDVAFLNQKRFVHILDGILFFADDHGNRFHADGHAAVAGDGVEDFAVHCVKPRLVHAFALQALLRNRTGYHAVAFDFRPIAQPAQQAVGDAWRFARARGDFLRGFRFDGGFKYCGGADDDAREFLCGIERKFLWNSEAVLERAAEQAVARGCADQREGLEIEFYRTRRWALIDGHVDEKILHRRIKIFFKRRGQAVNFIDEKHRSFRKRCEQPDEIARFFQRGRGCALIPDAKFFRDDARERGFAEARRAGEQHVVERAAALLRGFHVDLQILLNALLPDKIGEALRAQRALDGFLVGFLFFLAGHAR